ncbi:MAG: ligand-binding sensor domain-containing protein [Blastocatellia bacterium]
MLTCFAPMLRSAIRLRIGVGQVCLYGLLAALCPASIAQAQYRFDHWTADTGLPQNSVRAILQTRDGYLWVATLDGMARFDGVRFTIFDKSNTPGINSNRFIALYEDGAGDLWMGTEDGGVTRRREGKFTSYTTEHGLPSTYVPTVFGDESGGLWALSGSQLVQWADGKFTPCRIPGFEAPLSYGQYGWDARGVSTINRKDWSRFAHGRLNTRAMADGRKVNVFDEDQYGTEWGVADGSLVKIRDGKVVRVYTARDGLPDGFEGISLGVARLIVLEDRRGNLWLNRPGAWMGRLNSGVFTAYSAPSASTPSLPGNEVNAFYEDSEDNVWMGTERNGLYRVRAQALTTYSVQQGLQANNIYPILEDRSGAVWVGAWNKGLSRIKDGAIANYSTADGLSAYPLVTALHEDREGRLWIGHQGGLRIFQGGRINAPKIHLPNVALAIHQDRAGAFWFGTEVGLYRYQNGNLARFTTTEGLAGHGLAGLGLFGHDIKTIIESRDGTLWIGAYGGLIRFKDDRFTAWTEAQGLPSNRVRALYEDGEGALWIGTYDSGLGRFKDGKFAHYTVKDGLFNNGVFQILEDGRGNLWMSCNKGIYRVSKRELNEFADGKIRTINSVSYDRSDGMLNVECNGGRWPAGVKTRDGKLWFPTQDGVVVIDPEKVPTNPKPPPVLIEAFLLDRESAPFDGGVRIEPGKENFEIQYTGLSFVNSDRLKFKYKLEGLHDDWVDAGERRTAYYSYVPAGSYLFTVVAANSDGVWNTKGQSLRIIVLPPFHRTWWFLSLAALGVAGVIFAAFKYRVTQIERRQSAQQAFSRQLIESQEGERKRIAAELHDGLGQNLLVVKNRALLGLSQPDDGARAIAQLNEISTAVSQSLEEVRQIAANLHPYQLDRLGLTKAIEAMTRKVAAAAELDIATEIDNIDGLFDAKAEINLYRIVQESLNNIVKHSAADAASVVIKRAAQSVTVAIHDNGKGFAAGDLKPGFGLTGIAERARMLGGAHAIDSIPGKGATVTLTIGLDRRRER